MVMYDNKYKKKEKKKLNQALNFNLMHTVHVQQQIFQDLGDYFKNINTNVANKSNAASTHKTIQYSAN